MVSAQPQFVIDSDKTALQPWPDIRGKKRCQRCLYDFETPSIVFDDQGICNYCKIHDEMDKEYPVGVEGAERLKIMVDEIKRAGRRKRYDCVIGVSGGCDSSYMIHKAVEMGLRPLAVHFDNTWNSAIATENIHRVLKKLNVDLYTLVVDNKEYDDIYRSFFKSGAPDIEAPTDIALAVTMYRAATKYGINYVLEGHSFRTEGISPIGWLYMDGRYIKSVHQQYGTVKMKTYPNMPLWQFLRWTTFSNIKKIRPLYFMDYHKEDAKKLLAEKYDWQWYGGHHLENRFTAFYHSYFVPKRMGVDMRVLGYSAMVRSGQLTRNEAFEMLCEPPSFSMDLIDLVKKRMGFSDEEFNRYMNAPLRSYREFKTYKKTFERLRPLFWLLYKFNRVPKSFYIKFTSPSK